MDNPPIHPFFLASSLFHPDGIPPPNQEKKVGDEEGGWEGEEVKEEDTQKGLRTFSPFSSSLAPLLLPLSFYPLPQPPPLTRIERF